MQKFDLLIGNYLIKKLFLYFFASLFILLVIIFGNQYFLVAKESLKIGFYSSELLPFISLKIIRDFPAILVFSTVIALIILFQELKKSSERVVLCSAGLGIFRTIKIISPFIVLICATLIFSSLFFSPWSKQELFNFKESAKSRPEYLFLKEAQFQNFSDFVFYTDSAVNNNGVYLLKNVKLFATKSTNKKRYIFARDGQRYIDQKNGNVYLKLRDGKIYEYSDKLEINEISKFGSLEVLLHQDFIAEELTADSEIEYATMEKLLMNLSDKSISELLNRISYTILLIVFIPSILFLINSSDRAGKDFSIIKIFSLLLAYWYSLIILKDLVDKELLNLYLGFFLPHLSFIILYSLIYSYSKRI